MLTQGKQDTGKVSEDHKGSVGTSHTFKHLCTNTKTWMG